MAVVLVLCTTAAWLRGRLAAREAEQSLAASEAAQSPADAREPEAEEAAAQAALQSWGRVARGARRLRQVRRLWHCLGLHLRVVKDRGRA